MKLHQTIKQAVLSQFGKNVAKMISGTSVSQAIVILISPVLTRLYSPSEFGLLAVYSSLISIIGIAGTGRYEIAIVLPRREREAANVFALSVFIALCIGAALLLLTIAFGSEAATLLEQPDLQKWLFLLPLSIAVGGIYQAFSFWNNRKGRFGVISKSRVVQSGSVSAVQTGMGAASLTSGGLIAGLVSGQLISTIYLAKKSYRSVSEYWKYINYRRILACARKYKRFPVYSVWGGLANTGASHMPVFFITQIFGGAVTGIYSLALRVVNLPATVITSSLTDVFFKEVVSISHSDPGRLPQFVWRLFLTLFLVSLPPVLILFMWGEQIFGFVFGQEWARAGTFAGILSFAMAIKFSVSPLSAVLGLVRHIRKGFIWQNIYLATITATLILAASLPVDLFIIALTVHEIVLYLIYLAIILHAAHNC